MRQNLNALAIAFAFSGMLPDANAFALFDRDLAIPIFSQDGTFKVYKAKNDEKPLAEIQNLPYYEVV